MAKKGFCLILVLIIALSVFSGCAKEKDYSNDIIGKWECKSGKETMVIEFKGDGTGTAKLTPKPTQEALQEEVSIKYTLEGENITIFSYPQDDSDFAIGKGEYSIWYYKGMLHIRPKGSTAEPNEFYRIG